MLNRIKNNLLGKHRKIMTVFFLFAVVGGVFLSVHSVQALSGPNAFDAAGAAISGAKALVGVATGASTISGGLLDIVSWGFLGLANLLIQLAVWSLELFKALAGYNGFMDAPPVVLGWLMMRDLANMFFVVALLVIAFGTILGLEQYEWKRSLMKLVLAAVFINFSKLILQLIIDASNVFTVTFLNALSDSAGSNLINMFKLAEVQKMASGGLNTNDGISLQVFIGAVMSLIMTGMTFMTIGAYMVIMVARIVVLWVLMILSPLAFVASAFPSGKQYSQEFWQKFIHHVMVAPVMVFFLWLAFATMGSGTIANQLGINISQVSQSGLPQNILPGNTALNEPAVSISSASTWANLSSFAIGIAFLIVGIGFVQKLGVVGGGLTSKAQAFGMSVATIASGYAAGRWLVGKGTEGARGVAADYGKIAWGKTGERVLNAPYLRKIPIIGGAAGVGRKMAVKRTETLQKEQLRRYEAEGPSGPLGIGLKMEKEKEEIEKLAGESTYMEGRSEDEKKRIRAAATKEMFRDDHNTFATQNLEELQATLKINFESEDASSPVRQLYDKAKKHIEAGDEGRDAVDTVKDLEKALLKDERYKGQLTNQVRRDIDRKAAKGTFMISKELEGQYAEEQAGGEKSRKDEISGFFKFGYQKNEMEAYEKGFNETRRDLMVGKHLRDTRGMTDEQISKMSEEEKQREWDNITDDSTRLKLHRSFSNAEVSEAFVSSGKFDDLAKVGGAFEEYSSQRRLNKQKKAAEVAAQAVEDVSRGMEGKSDDQSRREEIKRAQDLLAKQNGYTFKRSEDELKAGSSEIKALREKITDKTQRGQSTEAEEKQLKSKVQTQAILWASFKKDFTGAVAPMLGQLVKGSKGALTADNVGQLEVAAITGKDWDDVKDDAGFAKTEEEMHKHFDEKDARILYALQLADSAAEKNNFAVHAGQIGEGVNESGRMRVGYTRSMKQALGEGKVLGTGKEKDGTTERVEYVRGNIEPNISNLNTPDGRALWEISVEDGRAQKIASDYAKKAIITAISTGKGLESQTDKRAQLGGSYTQKAYDAITESFNNMTADVHNVIAEGYRAGLDAIEGAEGTPQKGKLVESMRNGLRAADVTVWHDAGRNIVDVNKADQKQLQWFVEEKIIKGAQLPPPPATPPPPPPIQPPPSGGGGSQPKNPTPQPPKPPQPPAQPAQGAPTPTPSPTSSAPEAQAPINADWGKATQETLNLNTILKKVNEDLRNFSANLADSFASMPVIPSDMEDKLREIAKKSGASPIESQSAQIDYKIGQAVNSAINSNDDKSINEITKKISAIKDEGKRNEITGLLNNEGSLNEADLMKIGRIFKQALSYSVADIREQNKDKIEKNKKTTY